MSWQTIQDFPTDNANLIGAIAGLIVFAGVLVARGLWMYQRVSGRDKPAAPGVLVARGLWMYQRVSGRDKPAAPADLAANDERRADGARQDETRKRGRPGPSA